MKSRMIVCILLILLAVITQTHFVEMANHAGHTRDSMDAMLADKLADKLVNKLVGKLADKLVVRAVSMRPQYTDLDSVTLGKHRSLPVSQAPQLPSLPSFRSPSLPVSHAPGLPGSLQSHFPRPAKASFKTHATPFRRSKQMREKAVRTIYSEHKASQHASIDEGDEVDSYTTPTAPYTGTHPDMWTNPPLWYRRKKERQAKMERRIAE